MKTYQQSPRTAHLPLDPDHHAATPTSSTGEDGTAVFEFVLILPFVLVLLFLVTEATAALKTWMIIENASREGARCAAVRKTVADAQLCAVNRSGGVLSTGDVTVSGAFPTIQSDNPVTVSVAYTYAFKSPLASMLSFIGGGSISTSMTMNANTSMRME